MSILWIVFAAMVVIVSACDAMSLLYERDTQWKEMPRRIWWLKFVCNVLVVCAAIALMLVREGAPS